MSLILATIDSWCLFISICGSFLLLLSVFPSFCVKKIVRKLHTSSTSRSGFLHYFSKITHDSRSVVIPCPDFLYTTAVVDSSGSILRFNAPASEYASLGVYDDNGSCIDIASHPNKELDALIVGCSVPDDVIENRFGGDANDDSKNRRHIIRMTSPTGLLLHRLLVPHPEDVTVYAKDIQSKITCSAFEVNNTDDKFQSLAIKMGVLLIICGMTLLKFSSSSAASSSSSLNTRGVEEDSTHTYSTFLCEWLVEPLLTLIMTYIIGPLLDCVVAVLQCYAGWQHNGDAPSIIISIYNYHAAATSSWAFIIGSVVGSIVFVVAVMLLKKPYWATLLNVTSKTVVGQWYFHALKHHNTDASDGDGDTIERNGRATSTNNITRQRRGKSISYTSLLEATRNPLRWTLEEYFILPLSRLVAFLHGALGLLPSEVVYGTTTRDSAGKPLEYGKRYMITIPKLDLGSQWWSITLYAHDLFLVPNEEQVYSINSFQLKDIVYEHSKMMTKKIKEGKLEKTEIPLRVLVSATKPSEEESRALGHCFWIPFPSLTSAKEMKKAKSSPPRFVIRVYRPCHDWLYVTDAASCPVIEALDATNK